ncbi:LptF/LptG permease family protein [Occallatibacter riparius]|uniref:Uncharacterized protein n=1 Tax=Occallatibacter riparius TaxID=1002689 RepID=A0A9J7BIW2_9BACT|nr:hypothetical protein [Occallatibacter riparius]UWZ82443.1 hypothetical protein MOP44_17920 [Occallatibacter riparius]
MNLTIVPVSLIILAAVSVPAAMLIPRSRAKGRMRLAGSLLLGMGFISEFPAALHDVPPLWRAALVPIGGLFLVWAGIRKYRRDPEGRTSPAQIL